MPDTDVAVALGSDSLELDGVRRIDLRTLRGVAEGTVRVTAGEAVLARMRASEVVLARQLASGRPIYGVTTGFGPEARHGVPLDDSIDLQRNLLYHLASGVGPPLSPSATRAMMFARAVSLANGYSALGVRVFDLLLACLNAGVLPSVPEAGTVGASGDLTPLAHLGLLLIGEGDATYRGATLSARDALDRAGLVPIDLERKDGIALVNGTAAMTGIAALSGVRARRLLEVTLRLGALYAECLDGHAEAFDPRLGTVRPHPGQRHIHARLAALLGDSMRLRRANHVERDGDLLQDPYSIRCLPQIFGAAHDVLDFHDGVVETELNAATDNPLVFAADGDVVHGGNFFGQPVAYASDALALVVINAAIHAERAIARTCNPTQNRGLPAFLHAPPSGLNSGFMGAQVTASALVAEMRVLASPASVQSIPTNGDNQDVVPMGTIAARKTARLLDLAWPVVAIEAMVLAEAVERRGDDPSDGRRFASEGRALVAWIRERVAPVSRDRPLSGDIARLAAAFDAADWTAGLCAP